MKYHRWFLLNERRGGHVLFASQAGRTLLSVELLKRFYERSWTVSLWRRFISIRYFRLHTHGMDRWYFSAYRGFYGIGGRHTAYSLVVHVPNFVFNFNLRVEIMRQ